MNTVTVRGSVKVLKIEKKSPTILEKRFTKEFRSVFLEMELVW